MLSVSSPVDPAALAAGLDALRFAGLDPVTYPSARDQGTLRPYLAGDDAMRAGDLRAALTDPAIAGICSPAAAPAPSAPWRRWTGPAWPGWRPRSWPATPM